MSGSYTVFLSTDDPAIAYGVVALTDPFEDLVGPYLPMMTETVLSRWKTVHRVFVGRQ